VPLWPGDWPHPLLFAGGRVVFAGAGGTYATDPSAPAAERIGGGGYPVTGERPGGVLLVGTDRERRTLTDFTGDGRVSNVRWLGDGVDAVIAGAGGGYVVRPFDRDAYGFAAFLTADGELRPLAPSVASPYRVLGALGNRALIAVEGGPLAVVDVRSGAVVHDLAPLRPADAAPVDRACWSPDGAHLVLLDATASATVIAVADEPAVVSIVGDVGPGGIGWASPTELVVVATTAGTAGWEVALVDVANGARATIATFSADVRPFGRWWLATAAAGC
jgi:hypothetical protein